MADFVAVIRKAVDGLANNTPETRGKVYEKARSAVVRQLENMKPRPPEELLNRQIAKLDSAIAEVESEYAEALPALEDDEDDFLPAQEAPYYDDEPQPVETPEEVETGPEVEPETETETAAEPEPQVVAYEEPAPAEPEAIEPEVAPEPEQYIEDAQQPPADETHAHADWVGADSPEADDWRAADELPVEEAAPEPELYAGQWTQNNSADEVASPDAAGDGETAYDSGYTSPQQYEQDVQVQISEPRFDTIADDRRALDAAADDIFGTNDPYSTTAEPLDFTQERNDRRDEATLGFGAAAGAGAVAGSAAAAGSEDFKRFFDDAIDDSSRSSSSPSGLPRADADPFAQQSEGGKRDAWDDLEDLIGYDGRKSDDGLEVSSLGANDGTLRSETTSTIPPNVYVKPKKNRTKEILLAAVALVVIAGGAYALYENRAALNDMVGGLTESAQSDAQPATGDANSATQTGTAQGSPLPSANGDSNNGETTGTKFTQRLLADGTEKDEGPAAVLSNQPVTAEGVSQAEKNAEAAPTPAVEAPAAGATPSTGAAQPAPASQTPAVAVAGERIFLYEEVLGQSAPSAIPGTVAWSLVNEQDANGKSVPTVQAQLNVPERGLTALLTFKKNTDASLPASHIVEVVFSTSGGFEGGAIDSVQRIAMKATEQDRGNALIAVPAKITEDFHMIALNDFPDARKTNMDLLSSRDWLDIPLAYRNGRRALLTLQKGPAGKQAFETALREWQASGSQ